MIILAVGLLLLVVAVVLIVAGFAGGGDSVALEVFGLDFEIWASAFFGAGVVTTVLAIGGAFALRVGIQQLGIRRKEVEFLRQRVAELEGTGPQTGKAENSAGKGKSSAGEGSAGKGKGSAGEGSAGKDDGSAGEGSAAKGKSSAGNVPAASG